MGRKNLESDKVKDFYKDFNREIRNNFWSKPTCVVVGFLAGVILTYGSMVYQAIKIDNNNLRDEKSIDSKLVYEPNDIISN